MIDLLFWGLTVGIAGKVLLGYSVVMVHAHVIKEKQIDRDVIFAMKRERIVALIGIALILAGYAMELAFYGFIPGLEGGFDLMLANAMLSQ